MRHRKQSAETIGRLVRHHLPRHAHGSLSELTAGLPQGGGQLGVTSTINGNTTALSGNQQNSALSDTIKEAATQIQQWRATTQSQQELLNQNTSALQQNTSAQSKGSSAGGLLKGITGFLGGGLGSIPLLSGILGLFGGGSKAAPTPLTYSVAPPSIQFDQAVGSAGSSATSYDQYGAPRSAATATQQTAPSQNITVNVQAMDSRGFLDHSAEIALAVKDAMLNLHSINDVVNEL